MGVWSPSDGRGSGRAVRSPARGGTGGCGRRRTGRGTSRAAHDREAADALGRRGEGGRPAARLGQQLEMAARAAAAGLGVAITDLRLFRDELASGRLAAPFGPVVSEDTGYLLFAERGRFAEPGVTAFRDWLLAEAAADGDG